MAWAHLGLQRLRALPGACEACARALLSLPQEPSVVAQQLGAQFRPLLPPTCPLSPISSHSYTYPSPPSATWGPPFLNRPPGLCTVAPSIGMYNLSPPGSCKTQSAPCASHLEAPRVLQAESVAPSLESTRPLEYPLLRAEQYLPLGCDYFSCLFPSLTTDWALTEGRGQLSPHAASHGPTAQHRAWHQGETPHNLGLGFPSRRYYFVALRVPHLS